MDIKLSAEITGLDQLLKRLNAVSKDKWGKILADASNETGFYLVNKFKVEMPKYLDRPKPFTLNALYVMKAGTNRGLTEATVAFRDRGGKANFAGHYLLPQVEGGSRQFKRFEMALQYSGLIPMGTYVVPSAFVKLDAYGNVPGGYITRMLSALRALSEVGYTANRKVGKRTRNKMLEYYVVSFGVIRGGSGAPQRTTLADGIYEKHAGERKLYQVFHFVHRLSYKPRFPWYEIGQKAARAKFPEKLDEAIKKFSK